MSVRHDITVKTLEADGYRVLHAGDDYEYSFEITRGGSALDLTGATLWFTIKARSSQTDAQAKLQLSSASSSEIEITNAANGEFTVKFSSTGTADLEGMWDYDMQTKLADDSVITLARGKIEFLPNTTRTTS